MTIAQQDLYEHAFRKLKACASASIRNRSPKIAAEQILATLSHFGVAEAATYATFESQDMRDSLVSRKRS